MYISKLKKYDIGNNVTLLQLYTWQKSQRIFINEDSNYRSILSQDVGETDKR